MIISENPIIESSRCKFFLFTHNDYELLLNLETDEEARKYFGGVASAEIVEKMLSTFIGSYNQYGFSYFKVFDKIDNKFIGAAGFDQHKETGEIGIGYIFYKEYWLDSYPQEVIRELLRWGKDRIFTDHFIAVVHADDEIAKNTMVNCGMAFYKAEQFANIPCIYYKISNI